MGRPSRPARSRCASATACSSRGCARTSWPRGSRRGWPRERLVTPPRAKTAGKLVVTGLPMAPGLAVGSAVFHTDHDVDVPVLSIVDADVEGELRRLQQAIDDARQQLVELEQRIERQVGSADARIFSMQGLLLED